VGFGVGAALTFFVNDLIGRIWSFRLYTLIYCIGSIMAIFSPNANVLYGTRFIQGFGLGPMTVSGPISIVEIAPTEIRGLLASWSVLLVSIGLFASELCALGVHLHVPVGN
jgi:MFS family permease